MLWHHANTSKDDVMRIPADGEAWKHVDREYPEFAAEHRNIRFGLASDGFNPFSQQSTKYSIWPVMLVNYNMPPWHSIKNGHIFLTMIFPGPKQVKKPDTYLRLLVDELKMLWQQGVEVEDMSREPGDGRFFSLRAILMWTMHDYPGYSFISKLQTKGHRACPICWKGLAARRSTSMKKMMYDCNFRRHLPAGHEFRVALKDKFNG